MLLCIGGVVRNRSPVMTSDFVAESGKLNTDYLPLSSMSDLAGLRQEYKLHSLDLPDLAEDPIEQFARWFSEARAAELAEPNAMILATVDAEGQPSSRAVLLKGIDAGGFAFFTSYQS